MTDTGTQIQTGGPPDTALSASPETRRQIWEAVKHSDYHRSVDELENLMVERGTPQEIPTRGFFTPGLFVREVFMPAGSLVTSKIHATRHPFVLSKGRVRVLDARGPVELAAPFTGVTEAGTRRVLFILEDAIWTTFHPTDKTTVEEVEADIIFKHDEHLQLEDKQ